MVFPYLKKQAVFTKDCLFFYQHYDRMPKQTNWHSPNCRCQYLGKNLDGSSLKV